jgi:hypothetical protein
MNSLFFTGMTTPEQKATSDWLDDFRAGSLQPDYVLRQDDTGFARAWVRRHNGDYYVYYEEGHDEESLDEEDADTTKHSLMLLGSVAAMAVDGYGEPQKLNMLLDSALSPVTERNKVPEHLKALMNLSGNPLRQREAVSPEMSAHRPRFNDKFARLTKLDLIDIDSIGLWRMGTRPRFSEEEKAVLIISRFDIEGEWPVIRYGLKPRRWDIRFLPEHEYLGLSGFDDAEQLAMRLKNGTWHHVRLSEVVRLTDRLAEKSQYESL